MFDINNDFINENKKNIVIILGIFVLFFILLVVFGGCDKIYLDEKELQENGNNLISKLVINEIMTSNGGALADANGKTNDWIELYNGNEKDINLKNYGLSDRENTIKWVFPEVIIPAKSYMIVYLSGKNQEGLYANFKLSSAGGEVIAIKDPSGKVIDAVETSPLDKNTVMARDMNGSWFSSKEATPGYNNTKEGYASFVEGLIDETSSIKINEVLPRNEGNFKINDKYSGYIEIINTGKETISLEGYSISDSWSAPFRYQLPNVVLTPNEVLVIYMDSIIGNVDELYSGFKLESKNGVAILSDNHGKIIDKVEYKDLPNGMAMVKNSDNFYESSQLSPGYVNTVDGGKQFSDKKLQNPEGLIINEVMNSNSKYLPQNGAEYYDWIELKNNSNKAILLSDYYLTTNEDIKNKYQLPDVELKAGQTYILMASGDSNLSNNSYKHTNFKLSEIESLYLIKDKKIMDSMFIAEIPVGYSMGRNNKSGFYYFSSPTPGKENGSGTREIAYTPIIDMASGVYNNVEEVIVQVKAGGTIYYTLDGSKPTKNSKVYKGPLSLAKTSVVKVMSVENGKLSSPVVVNSYIINENHTMPVMSVSLNQSDFNYVQGNPWVEGIEVPAYAELYEENNSFSIPCGFKLFGGSTRGLAKKSFSLKFRKEYGEAQLNYQVFENRDYSIYDTLVLRSGSQDYSVTMMKDVLMTSLVDGKINVNVQAYKPVILYINGKYWGIYNIREKVDEKYISRNYNVNEEGTNIVSILNSVSAGTSTTYNQLVNYIANHDMTIDSNYEYVKTKLNLESYADYWAAHNYVTNNDILNTRFFSNPNVDDGRFNMIFYDLDYAMRNIRHNYFNFMTDPEGMSDFKVPTIVMRKLIKNKDFQQLFLERLSYQLKNVWSEENVLKRIDEIYNNLLPEMPRHQKRWNLTMDEWQTEVEYLRKYAREREEYLVKYAKSFFGLSKEEVRKYFGDSYA